MERFGFTPADNTTGKTIFDQFAFDIDSRMDIIDETEKLNAEKKKIQQKAKKAGMTVEEYKKAEIAKRQAKALADKKKRYEKELAEAKARIAYLEKWLEEN